MAQNAALIQDRRRRSSRLLCEPSDEILVGVPADTPRQEQLVILLRKCWFATLKNLQQEQSISQQLYKGLSEAGYKIFEDDGAVCKLAVLATDPDSEAKSKSLLEHNERLNQMEEESKKWEELLKSVHPQLDSPEEMVVEPWAYNYQALLDICLNCRRRAKLCVERGQQFAENVKPYAELRSQACKVTDVASFLEDDPADLFQKMVEKK